MFRKKAFVPYFKVFCVLVFFYFYFLFAGISNATTHYVSPIGKGTWANSTNIKTPCSVSTAMTNAAAGDTVYFRGGTYTVPQEPSAGYCYYHLKQSGTASNPITFAAYPGETPVLDGTVLTPIVPSRDFAAIFKFLYASYWIFDGFSFQANGGTAMVQAFYIRGEQGFGVSTNITIKNCIFNGGSVPITQTDNRQAIYIASPNESTPNKKITVQRCKFYNYKEIKNNQNTGGIKVYHSRFVTVENCEFYNNTIGCFFKSDADDSVFRYNYVHDCGTGVFFAPSMLAMNTDRVQIYHNVVVNNTSAGISYPGAGNDAGTHGDDFVIYNNTVYGTGSNYSTGLVVGWTQSGHGATVYNNILWSRGTGITYGFISQQVDANTRNYLMAVDHNQWGTPWKKIAASFYYKNRYYSSLLAWQASEELENAVDVGCGSNRHPGCGDLSSDPKFLNGSGNMNQLADFRLATNSPCKGAGRGGVDMGANIDLVGILSK